MIKPLNGQFVGALNENDQHALFLIAVKINELVVTVNDLVERDRQLVTEDTPSRNPMTLLGKE